MSDTQDKTIAGGGTGAECAVDAQHPPWPAGVMEGGRKRDEDPKSSTERQQSKRPKILMSVSEAGRETLHIGEVTHKAMV